MPLVQDGDKSKPFLITRDSAYGDWQVCYPAPDKADGFTVSQREHDHYTAKYYGADFDGGSMPYVYNKVLCDRLRCEYYEYREEDRQFDTDKKRLHALINFFEDNVNSFSHTTTDYLAGLDQPFRAIDKMCPYNLATNWQDWTFNEDLAADAVDVIENTVKDRLNTHADKPAPEKLSRDGYKEINKVSVNSSDVILAENPDAEYRYMVVENRYTSYYNNSGDNNIYTGHTNDYLEAITEFTKMVQNNIGCVQSRRDLRQSMDGIDYVELKSGDCLPGSDNDNFTGKLIIVKAGELKPEYRSSENQLVVCSHGNGARPNAIGTSVFGKELYSGDSVAYGRHQIQGIADETKLPQWAKVKLELQRDSSIFEFGGYHFKPYRKFHKKEVDIPLKGDSRPWKKDAQYAMRNMSSDRSLGISAYDWGKTEYSHEKFYEAAQGSDADIFKCLENGKLYVPCANELFRYNEPPLNEKAAQKPAQPPQSKQPPSLLGEVREAARLVEQRKAERGNAPSTKNKDGLEV